MAYYNNNNRQKLPRYISNIYPINPMPDSPQETFASISVPVEEPTNVDDEQEETYEKTSSPYPINNTPSFQEPHRPKPTLPRWWR